MERAEWEKKFGERIIERVDLNPHDKGTKEMIAAELESWPESNPDWKDTTPEEAADEQLSNWTE
jgi:hypothetical protein